MNHSWDRGSEFSGGRKGGRKDSIFQDTKVYWWDRVIIHWVSKSARDDPIHCVLWCYDIFLFWLLFIRRGCREHAFVFPNLLLVITFISLPADSINSRHRLAFELKNLAWIELGPENMFTWPNNLQARQNPLVATPKGWSRSGSVFTSIFRL